MAVLATLQQAVDAANNPTASMAYTTLSFALQGQGDSKTATLLVVDQDLIRRLQEIMSLIQTSLNLSQALLIDRESSYTIQEVR